MDMTHEKARVEFPIHEIFWNLSPRLERRRYNITKSLFLISDRVFGCYNWILSPIFITDNKLRCDSLRSSVDLSRQVSGIERSKEFSRISPIPSSFSCEMDDSHTRWYSFIIPHVLGNTFCLNQFLIIFYSDYRRINRS